MEVNPKDPNYIPPPEEPEEIIEEGGELGERAKEAGQRAKETAGKAKEAGGKIGKKAAEKGAEEAASQAVNAGEDVAQRGIQSALASTGIGNIVNPIIEFVGDVYKWMPSWMRKWGCAFSCGCITLVPIAFLAMMIFAANWSWGDTGNTTPSTGVLAEVPLYKQWDPKWGDFDFDCGGTTLSSSGCNVTALAMVISYWTGKEVLPTETAKVALDKGWRGGGGCTDGGSSCNGICWEAYHEMPKLYGLQSKHVTWEQAKEYLKKGWPIIQNHTSGVFTNNGHYIVITGINSDGTFAINDPDGKHVEKATEAEILASNVTQYIIWK